MHFRRNIALAAGALVLAAPLSSCGFNYATDRVNQLAPGTNDYAKSVDVLGAVIVASRPDTGTFIASFSNNSATQEFTFTDLAGAEGNTLTADSFDPVVIAAMGAVNLAIEGGVRVNGSFEAGQYLPVTVGFGNGEAVVMHIPVVTPCNQYAGLDNAPTTVPADGASPSAEATPTAEATPYSCAPETSVGE
ncbi:MAG: hypothetical protein JWO11_4207 [Nocardioides sp.]|nr:hypothetical protein [Nocardioides sp.]